MNDFTILGRQKNGTNVYGYILMNNATGKVGAVEKNKVYELAMKKMIKDVIAQEYDGKITMKGTKTKISDLPNYDMNGKIISRDQSFNGEKPKMILNGKCKDGKNITAYRVAVVENGKIVKEAIFGRDKIIEYAKLGLIENVRHQTSNGVDVLRGVDCKIFRLPIVGTTRV